MIEANQILDAIHRLYGPYDVEIALCGASGQLVSYAARSVTNEPIVGLLWRFTLESAEDAAHKVAEVLKLRPASADWPG